MEEVKIILSSKAAAEEVLYYMQMRLATHKVVTMADYRTLVGLKETHNDLKFGWKSLDDVVIVRVRDGWTLSWPKPEPI
jgi:hypothetical protein